MKKFFLFLTLLIISGIIEFLLIDWKFFFRNVLRMVSTLATYIAIIGGILSAIVLLSYALVTYKVSVGKMHYSGSELENLIGLIYQNQEWLIFLALSYLGCMTLLYLKEKTAMKDFLLF